MLTTLLVALPLCLQPQSAAMTPVELVELADDLAWNETVTVRFRVGPIDRATYQEATTEPAFEELQLFPAGNELTLRGTSFHVGLHPDAQAACEQIGIHRESDFVGRVIEATGRVVRTGYHPVAPPPHVMYSMMIRDPEQLRVLDDAVPLADAVDGFNRDAARRRPGHVQPALTVDECLAAFRWALLEVDHRDARESRISAPPTDETFDLLRSIVRDGALPTNAELELMTDFEPDGRHVFARWSIRLRIHRSDGTGSYCVEIRERMLSSRLMGPAEREVVARFEARFREGVGSMYRGAVMERYRAERARAIARDEADGAAPGQP